MAKQGKEWPAGYKKIQSTKVDNFMVSDKDTKQIAYIDRNELVNSIEITGELIDPIAPGTAQAPAVIPAGPAGQKRKFTPAPGFYRSGSTTFPEVTSDKIWYFYWNSLAWQLVNTGDLPKQPDPVSIPGQSTTFPASQKLATDIQNNIFSDDKPIRLGELISGRYASNTNATPDTNSSYLRTNLIDVLPEWDILKNNVQSGSSHSWQFDKYGQPLGVILWTTVERNGVTWYKASKHPKVAKVAFSGSPTNMNAAIVLASSGVSASLKRSLGTNKYPETPTSQNQFTPEGLIYPFYVPAASTDGALVASNNFYITPAIPLLKTKGSLIVQNIPANGNSSGITFYKEDGTMVKNVHVRNTDLQLNGLNNGFYAPVGIPNNDLNENPAVPAYYRYWFDQRLYGSSMDSISKISITYSGNESAALLDPTFKNLGLTAEDVKKIMQALRKVNKDISDLVVLVLGDSNTENSGFRGSWGNWFQRLHRPKLIRVRAVAGATITSIENLFGEQYASGANTLLRQCEIEIQEYLANPSTFQKPDLIIITGGTNDFDLGRYVTPDIISTYPDYVSCMEDKFVTASPAFNVKRELSTIDRSKVGGALRYIHERFMEYFPEAVQMVATPLRSTLHNQVHAKRFVNEMMWMAERWQLAVIDVFNKGGITTIRDFGAERFNLKDKVHVFDNDGQSIGAFKYGIFIVDEVHKLYVPNTLEKLIS